MQNWIAKARIWLVLLCTFALLACASGPKQVFHSFECNGKSDVNKWADTVDLLEYSYGDQFRALRNSMDDPYTKALYRQSGRVGLNSCGSVTGFIPVGEFLYVKWRIKETGEVLEDRVDLRERLPKNMAHHTLTFSIDERQLHVFVVTPLPRKRTRIDPARPWMVAEKPTHLTWLSESDWTYEIYPVQESYPKSDLSPEQIKRCLRGEDLCATENPKK